LLATRAPSRVASS